MAIGAHTPRKVSHTSALTFSLICVFSGVSGILCFLVGTVTLAFGTLLTKNTFFGPLLTNKLFGIGLIAFALVLWIVCATAGTIARCVRSESMADQDVATLVTLVNVWRAAFVVLIFNFFIWVGVAAYLGGEAVTGRQEGDRYYVNGRKGYAEVSAAAYHYSRIHSYFTFGAAPFALFAVFAAKAASRLLSESH